MSRVPSSMKPVRAIRSRPGRRETGGKPWPPDAQGKMESPSDGTGSAGHLNRSPPKKIFLSC
jgi:hypothetical protein